MTTLGGLVNKYKDKKSELDQNMKKIQEEKESEETSEFYKNNIQTLINS
jgi:hypothetical protein